MNARPLPPEADRNQSRASDPSASAWVSANAGTGKTEVLVRRVLRLLLADSEPESILCLTYTKTAAAEMQNRLLDRLSSWATMSPDKLQEDLTALLRRAPNESDARTARKLFARALEAKGGLKIHTIHGFCERLLQRFPLESQVTPHFSVLDERDQALMRRAAFDAAVSHAAADSGSVLGRALAKVTALTSGDYIRQVIDTVCGRRAELARMVAYHQSREDWAEAEARALKRLFNVAEHEEQTLSEQLVDVLTEDEIDAALAAFVAYGGTTDMDKTAEAALRAARSSEGENRLAALKELFLKADGDVKARACSKAIGTSAPSICAALDRALADFAALTDKLAHVRLAEASAAVLVLADAVQADYERRKHAEAALDYDDLIVKARNLLSRAAAAAWVLYKIDGGIDHILVDEAQDTNPAQWAIIDALAMEFFSGQGARDRLRTLFAVGDEKQSIYSFQGADPKRFAEMGRAFRQRADALGLIWHEVPLNLSFRSTEPILQAVDHVFGRSPAADGVLWQEGAIIHHEPFRKGEAGLVELWEVQTEQKPVPSEAFEPWTEELAGARAVDALCKRIATAIHAWIGTEQLAAKGRKVRAGDILILVRRREPFTAPMIRELKRLGVKVAGADRMKLMDQLAVQDLVALADVLLMPEDDLALAVVLKSPLFGFDDDELFTLAHDRKGSLWTALKAKANGNPPFAEATEKLAEWLSRADLLPPYEFYSELLGAEDQRLRRAMLTRLGPEAAEAIDEFLNLALAYDRDAAPSLQGFVNQLRAGDVEIKRDMEQQRDEVRIMTVHGAKGLQAPVVILPDTCMRPRLQGVRLYPLPRAGEPPEQVGHLVWPPAKHSNLAGIEASKALVERAERQEYHRLLYVAMTRAEDRLYICGWEGLQRREEGKVWYDLVRHGLAGQLTAHADADGGPLHRLESAQTEPVTVSGLAAEQPVAVALPAWAAAIAPRERSRPKLAPSRLAFGLEGGAEGLPPEQPPLGPLALGQDGRYARGRLVHALLQHLPEVVPKDQERAARAFVAARGADLTQKLNDEIVAETLAIVRDPAFAPLFQPGSHAEVPVVARIGGYDLEGQIDRLAMVEDGLMILDYKTNRPPPKTLDEVSPAYIAQLAGYRTVLKGLFPGRPLRAALLWTDGPRLMEIPSTSLDDAERRLLQQTVEP